MAASMIVCGRIPSLARAAKVVSIQPVRFRWKPPDRDQFILPSYAQRLELWKSRYERPASEGINIGFKFESSSNESNKQQLLKKWAETRKALEQASRHRQLKIDMDKVKEEWNTESMPLHVCAAAEHYGIFRDMFNGAHFHPVVPMEISFEYDDEFVTPVCYGNVITASEASMKPSVVYEANDDSLWTIAVTSPDGSLEDSNKEILHWLVANIPGSEVEKGETLCNYLPPFPPKGVGFLRYVFILYKQNQRLDLKTLLSSPTSVSLRERTFSTLDFYKAHEQNITPAGLAFFQSEWDKSVTHIFHHVLDMKEPVFEFLHPAPYQPEQVQFPHKEPFYLYLDRFRDIKDIQEEVLKQKLKDVDPTKPPPPPPKYPDTGLLSPSIPSWLRTKINYMRKGRHQWKDLKDDS